MKAHEWHDRGTTSNDPIDAFANFWRGFNNLFAAQGKAQEREKIRAFIQASVTEDRAADILESAKHSVNYLLSEPVVDMRGNNKDTAGNVAAYGTATTERAKLEELAMIIYQVRCNLEHGQKSPNRQRDVQLCASSSPIIAAIVRGDA